MTDFPVAITPNVTTGHVAHHELLAQLFREQFVQDTLANRPAAGTERRVFFATDTGQWFRDDGAAWSEIIMAAHAAIDDPSVWCDIRSHGADELVGDNTGAVNAAITKAGAGGVVYVPGKFTCAGVLSALGQSVTFRGSHQPRTVNSGAFGVAGWATDLETGSWLRCSAAAGSFITDGGSNIGLNLDRLGVKGLGDATRTTVGVALGFGVQAHWTNVVILNFAVALSCDSGAGSEDATIVGITTRGNGIGISLGVNANANTIYGFDSTSDGTALFLNSAAGNTIAAKGIQGFWTCGIHFAGNAQRNIVTVAYMESSAPHALLAILFDGGGSVDGNSVTCPKINGLTVTVSKGNGNRFHFPGNNPTSMTLAAGTANNVVEGWGGISALVVDNGDNFVLDWTGGQGLTIRCAPTGISGMSGIKLQGAKIAFKLVGAGTETHVEHRDDLGYDRLYDAINNKEIMSWTPGAAPKWGVNGKQIVQPARPVTLADVINLIVAYGFSA